MTAAPEPTEEGGIWVRTELDPIKNSYVVTIDYGTDHSLGIDPSNVVQHVSAVYAAAHRAEYDAAVVRQLDNLVGREHAAQLITDMRSDRPPIDQSALAPLELLPGVNQAGDPFIAIMLAGKPVGQWTVSDALEHAEAVSSAVHVADLDTIYYRTLVNLVGLDAARASRAVADLINHRAPAVTS